MIRYALAALLALTAASPALADRGPSPEELQRISEAMKAAGYVGWGDVTLSEAGSHWAIADARKGDGTKWLVKLRPNTLGVMKAERDED